MRRPLRYAASDCIQKTDHSCLRTFFCYLPDKMTKSSNVKHIVNIMSTSSRLRSPSLPGSGVICASKQMQKKLPMMRIAAESANHT